MTTKTYLTSNILYTHLKHSHWLDELEANGLAQKLSGYESNIMRGCRLKSSNAKFSESIEYNHLKHKLDLVSGEYIGVIKPYARRLIKKQLEDKGISYDTADLQWTTNFSSTTDNNIENRLSGEFYKNGSYYFHSDNGMISVSFNDAEAFAYKEAGVKS